jgi:hypothetical protein
MQFVMKLRFGWPRVVVGVSLARIRAERLRKYFVYETLKSRLRLPPALFVMTGKHHTFGVISDTRGLLRPEAVDALRGCDRIVHAGDVGDPNILDSLAE